MAAAADSKEDTWKAQDPAAVEALFSRLAKDYEKMSGGVSKKVAEKSLPLLPPITSQSVIHDNGCGPGVVTKVILAQAEEKGEKPPRIEATDFAKGMIDYLNHEVKKNNWTTVNAQVRDAQDLGCFEDATFTHSFTTFAIFALPDAVKAAKEIRRTLKDGGVALVTTWKDIEHMKIVDKAQKAVRPDLPAFQFTHPDWWHDWKLSDTMKEAGFSKVEMHVIENWWQIPNEEALLSALNNPFWHGVALKEWSEEDKKKWPQALLDAWSEKQRKEGRMKADAWVCVAVK